MIFRSRKCRKLWQNRLGNSHRTMGGKKQNPMQEYTSVVASSLKIVANGYFGDKSFIYYT